MKNYKILDANRDTGTFVIEFEGKQPLNFFVPHDDSEFLSGDLLEQAIQAMYPDWEDKQKEKFANLNGWEKIDSLIDPEARAQKEERERLEQERLAAIEAAQNDENLPEEMSISIEQQMLDQRDVFLVASDFTQLPDAPFTDSQKQEFREYRQALRDLTESPDWPTVEFPITPYPLKIHEAPE